MTLIRPFFRSDMKRLVSALILSLYLTGSSLAQYGGSSYGLGGAGASNYISPLSGGLGGMGGYGLGANPYGSLSAPGYGKVLGENSPFCSYNSFQAATEPTETPDTLPSIGPTLSVRMALRRD